MAQQSSHYFGVKVLGFSIIASIAFDLNFTVNNAEMIFSIGKIMENQSK